MDEKRRAEIRTIVDFFRGKAVTQDVLKAYCERMHFDPIVVGDLQDYTAQVEHDETVGKLFPLILAELTHLQYNPEFADEAVRRDIVKRNDEVRVNITKLFEEHALEYKFVTSLSEELGNFVGGKIAMAGTTAFNKALEVLLHMAHERFGGNFTMKNAADYAKEFFEKQFDKKAE